MKLNISFWRVLLLSTITTNDSYDEILNDTNETLEYWYTSKHFFTLVDLTIHEPYIESEVN